MGLAHEKKSYLQEKANLFEIGSYHKDSEMSIPILLFFEKKVIFQKIVMTFAIHVRRACVTVLSAWRAPRSHKKRLLQSREVSQQPSGA